MINNSSLQKWERLAQKQLNQQFVNEIVDGLQCSPFEANAILDTVYKVYASYFETTGNLKPGQILFQVISIDTSSNTHLKDSKQTTVTLTLDAGEEDLKIREEKGVVGLRRHRIQRVSHETFQQGGLLTVEDLANRLTVEKEPYAGISNIFEITISFYLYAQQSKIWDAPSHIAVLL